MIVQTVPMRPFAPVRMDALPSFASDANPIIDSLVMNRASKDTRIRRTALKTITFDDNAGGAVTSIFTGQIQAPAGLLTAPGVSIGSPVQGFFSPSSNQIGVTLNSIERFRFTASTGGAWSILQSGGQVLPPFGITSNISNAPDIQLWRGGIGQLNVQKDATTGAMFDVSTDALASVKTRTGTDAATTRSSRLRTAGYTVATLPTGIVGDRAYVTDALAPTFLTAVVGGGAVVTPVFYDGANWIAD